LQASVTVGTMEEAARAAGGSNPEPLCGTEVALMTESKRTGHDAGGQSLEEVAQDGPLPETDDIDEAAEAGRDNSEIYPVGDNRDTDPIAGGGLLGKIAQSR
jgi:hypothetical protein